MDERKELLRWTHRGAEVGYFWWPDKTSEWWRGIPETFPDRTNTYFGVHPLDAIPMRGDPTRIRGTVDEIAAVACMFAEYDSKDFDGSLEAILEHIDQLPLRPSALVMSGHGYHAYWWLQEPLLLNGKTSRVDAIGRQRAWTQAMGGDSAAKDLARVLRLPGTKNHKVGQDPVDVEVVYLTDDAYTLDEIAEAARDAGDIKRLEQQSRATATYETLSTMSGIVAGSTEGTPDDVVKAMKAIGRLNLERADNYDSWVAVGMSLRELGNMGLMLWDNWSAKSDKYREGDCYRKWMTFTSGDDDDISLASLLHWAKMDSPSAGPSCPDNAKPSDYVEALHDLGYEFSLNIMNDDVSINGVVQDDVIRACIRTNLREHGFRNMSMAEDAWVADAAENKFHPIRDYLTSLEYDGMDHIASLCCFFDEGTNEKFNTFLKRFLIGACARPMAPPHGVQARAFVLDGPQGIGKSRFVRFLGSPLPHYFMESGINTDDKDFLRYLASVWIWEVAELGSTLRKSDRDALKHFISRQTIVMRKAYGRHDISKPAIASFLPTINNEAGFLWDPTGYRRFMVATVNSIDWGYETQLDINQIWAQAFRLYKAGEPWELPKHEAQLADESSKDYEVTDPLVDVILANFNVEPCNPGEGPFTSTYDILRTLKNGLHISETGRREAIQVGGLLLRLGAKRARVRPEGGGNPVHGFWGVERKQVTF